MPVDPKFIPLDVPLRYIVLLYTLTVDVSPVDIRLMPLMASVEFAAGVRRSPTRLFLIVIVLTAAPVTWNPQIRPTPLIPLPDDEKSYILFLCATIVVPPLNQIPLTVPVVR